MKIKGKLISSYIVIALLVLVVGAAGIWGTGEVQDDARLLYRNRVEPLGVMTEMIQTAENSRVQLLSGVTEEDPAGGNDATNTIQSMNGLLETYGAFDMEANERELFNLMSEQWHTYSAQAIDNARLVSNGSFEQAASGIAAIGNDFRTFRETLYQLRDGSLDIAKNDYDNASQSFEWARSIIFFMAIGVMILAIILGVVIGRLIGNPLKRIAARLTAIAQGDLTGDLLENKRKDEIGELTESMNMMQEDLQAVIRSVSNAAERVSSASEELTQSSLEVREGSEQIASTMQELSSGSETQAHTVSTLSEKMEFFLQKIADANEKTENVSEESITVIEKTDEGYKMMEEALNQMLKIDTIVNDAVKKVSSLEQRSNQVSKLVDVIQDIAEQTNLLALNAAIEAARAGEHGAGFAVVADEVRKLAENVSDSVREITTIIQGIQGDTKEVVNALESGYNEVNTGTVQMAQTGQNFTVINDAIKQMVEKVEYVSRTLSDVTNESVLINTSIEEIASVSEESAAGIEETAASSEQSASSMNEISSSANTLAELAESLSKEVSHFKTIS
ncbi:methyl-accepting chemotaxis protein [Halolactibacillus sp. JCM 19043]|uniref:methyl-accepting chemotaxis protein n=1 Tax=Halolactibacillus sp. JCM 19043 TaxID=1460638 RepID=UPI000781A303|nr:HAMP domain-containing methyl-accepting chemotaxis protein [Halolactibacillus sp. JCM 19043]